MWSKALVSSPPGSWHWSLGECSRSPMIRNRCCTRYNVCTCHKLDLDSWIPSPTAGCTLIPWSQVTLIRTSQVSPWIVQLAPISWPTNLPGPFCVQDMVHLATGMIVVLHVISEGAILTNGSTNCWLIAWQGPLSTKWGFTYPTKKSSASFSFFQYCHTVSVFMMSSVNCGETDQDLSVGVTLLY